MFCVTFSRCHFSVELEFSHAYILSYYMPDSRSQKESTPKFCGDSSHQISKRIRPIILWRQFPPNLEKNPPQNSVEAVPKNHHIQIHFKKKPDSRFTSIYNYQRIFHQICWAWAIFCRIIKSYLTDGRTDRWTDRQTDKLIWGGLDNLRFLQVKY